MADSGDTFNIEYIAVNKLASLLIQSSKSTTPKSTVTPLVTFNGGGYEFDVSDVFPDVAVPQPRGCELSWDNQDGFEFAFDEQSLTGDDASAGAFTAFDLEYILLSMFGSIVGIFFVCQVVIYCKGCTSRRHTWRLGKRRWWNVDRSRACGATTASGASLGGVSSSRGSTETMWAHQYDPFERVPCRPGLVYTPHLPGAAAVRAGSGRSLSSSSSDQDFQQAGTSSQGSFRQSVPGATVFMMDPRGPYPTRITELATVRNGRGMPPSRGPGKGRSVSFSEDTSSSSPDSHEPHDLGGGHPAPVHVKEVRVPSSEGDLSRKHQPAAKTRVKDTKNGATDKKRRSTPSRRTPEVTSQIAHVRVPEAPLVSKTSSSASVSCDSRDAAETLPLKKAARSGRHPVRHASHVIERQPEGGEASESGRNSEGSLTSVSSISIGAHYQAVRKYSNPLGRRTEAVIETSARKS